MVCKNAIVAASVIALTASGANAGETFDYTYDAQGRLIKVERSGTVNDNVDTVFEYDDAGNRTREKTTGVSGGGSLSITGAQSLPAGGTIEFIVTGGTAETIDLDFTNVNDPSGSSADIGVEAFLNNVSVGTWQQYVPEPGQSYTVSFSGQSFDKISVTDNEGDTTADVAVTIVSGTPSGGGGGGCSGSQSLSISSATDDGTYELDLSPPKTLDGGFGAAHSRWSSQGIGKAITYDLGSAVTVKELLLAWYRGNVRTAYFDVQTSTDGSTYQTILSGGQSDGVTPQWQFGTYDVPDTNARYVRIIANGNTENNWNSIMETEIHGCS